MKISALFCFILFISLASASDYLAEFRQAGEVITFKEITSDYETTIVDSSLLDQSKNGYYFTKKIVFNDSYSAVRVTLILDKGYYFDVGGIFPEGNVGSDGEKIYLTWEKYNVSKGDSFSMFVKIIGPNKLNSWIFIFFFIIFLVILIVLIILRKKKKFVKKSLVENKPNKILYLLDSEKKVIDELKKSGKEGIWQRRIQEVTGFSKAKVSRLVRDLESRGLVRKIPMGNTNKVVLK